MKKFLAIVFTISLVAYSCSDLDVENVNQPDREDSVTAHPINKVGNGHPVTLGQFRVQHICRSRMWIQHLL